jgi:DNA polymerase III subunit epsilon
LESEGEVILLGIDLESDSLDTSTANVLELAAVLYDWDTKSPVKMLSALIDPGFDGSEYTVPEEITAITGITTDQIRRWGEHEKDVLNQLSFVEGEADYYVAHNGNAFDAPLLAARKQKNGFGETSLSFLDTSIDIKFPPLIKTRNLRHLAAEHGFVNVLPHRALCDVLTMFKVMEHYDLDAIIARSQEPTLFVEALVSFEEKDLAKERGYHWCGPKKIWWRSWKLSDFEADKLECGFRTQLLDKAPE